MLSLLVYIIRSFVLILTIWFICNFIGKKSLAQFTPYDVAVLFIISNVISQPIVNKDLFKTSAGVIVLAISIVIIYNINLYTLLSMLRVQGYNKVADVNYVILEPSGDISVIPKSSARPATTSEMNLTLPEEGLTFAVIVEGKINKNILTYAKINEDWLLRELHKNYKAKPKDVFYAEIDSDKKLYADLYKQTS
ncbi:YetF domain-containing protein [Clostridium sp.]|uniref:DUF421 domain-containing protein n=1 Tax=Clostridium sp. TaxID=1506 RepID=UPI0025902BCD|nr:YetF domain-containing protein [Clostridium sp.]MDF2506108.1 hypothetical protein [Clostridium sp.]